MTSLTLYIVGLSIAGAIFLGLKEIADAIRERDQ